MTQRVLVLGYGNPGRRDDGLGPAFADAIARRGLAGVDADTRYQLQIEDAATIADYDAVVFADATRDASRPFTVRHLEPRPSAAFTTHSIAPDAVLSLAQTCFGCRTAGYLVAIRGHDFDDFGESLTPAAERDLAEAVEHLDRMLRSGALDPTTLSAVG